MRSGFSQLEGDPGGESPAHSSMFLSLYAPLLLRLELSNRAKSHALKVHRGEPGICWPAGFTCRLNVAFRTAALASHEFSFILN